MTLTANLFSLILFAGLLGATLASDEESYYGVGEDSAVNDTNELEAEEKEEGDFSKYWIAHGVCASVAWAILVPLAIGSAVLRKQFVHAGFSEGMWFQVHRALNLLAATLTIIAFALAVYVIRQEDGKSNWTEYPHFTAGLIIFLATLLQVTLALFRPHHHEIITETEKKEEMETAEQDDADEKLPHEKLTLRILWEHKHRFFGFALLGTSWWQIVTGWDLYEEEIGGKNQGNVFLAAATGISGTFLIIYSIHKAGELYGAKDV